MPFNRKLQKFSASINEVEIGTGDKAVKIGGQNVLPFYSFDGNIGNGAKVGIEISDLGVEGMPACIQACYEGCTSFADIAKKAASFEGVDFLALSLEGGDPNGLNKPTDELIAIVKEVADATDLPLVVEGAKNAEKDSELLAKVAEVLAGKNVLVMSAKEENYKAIGASAGLAYGQKVGAESAVDINLAKQLNVVMTQLGVNANSIVMNTGSASVGYGFDYTLSTFDRVRAAALGQDDKMLQMPIVTPVASETWGVKESTAAEADAPEGWGPVEARGISMEVQTAVACLASGSDAVILAHPVSVSTVAKLVKELV
ncbi:MAG: acetyl-CoA decarbonylase/synthase complex subunit delta [Eubacteriales bacterium]|nr:acetyl-CoA decarbonylase/synthase complex subunit delta [Eubacteriales bacterium]